MTNAVALVGITKSFAGISVLKDVSFDVRPGEVHALLGENGAGKSTLIKVIAGVHKPDSGTIALAGTPTTFASPRDARRLGVATVYQELLLFPELSVAENVFLGHAPRRKWRGLDWGAMRRRARELLDSLDSHDLDVDAKVGALSVANRQRVEIAKALAQDARVLIMDEPTAALAEADVRRLMSVVKRLRERGVAIIYVSHRMPEIFELADRVTVLRDGAHVGTRDIGDVDEAALVSMMVGRPLDRMFPKVHAPLGDIVLELRGVSHRQEVEDISLTLRAGEILGIAGLVGSGRT
jgi:rhamnose transport system ATP-binding protein